MRRAFAGVLLTLAAVGTAAQDAAPPGAYPVIREIVLQGNDVTQPKVMLREMLVRVGDPADPDRIERSRQNVQDLGLFRSVRMEQQPLADGIRLIFIVKEKLYVLPFPRVDASSDGGYGFGMQLRWSNLFGLNQSFRGFWERRQFAEGEADVEERGLLTRYRAEYFIPYVADTPYSLGWAAAYAEGPVTEPVRYDERMTMLGVSLTRRLAQEPGSQGWTVGGALGYRSQDTHGQLAPPQDGHATSIAALASNRDLHFKIYSDEGYRYGGRVEVATEGLASDYSYTYWGADYARFLPVGDKPHQTAHFFASVNARHGGPRDNEAFQLGGTGGLRGFEPETAKGDFAYLLTAEYLRPVFRNSIRSLVVLEAGNAFIEPGDADLDRVLVSAGLGVRVRVQAFVNLDLEIGIAWPVNGGGPRFFASKV